MKKFLSIFFVLIYLGTSSGFALQLHYCMDKFTGISIVAHEKEACGKCGMKKGANPCCKDELRFVKLQDSHKLIGGYSPLSAPHAVVQHLYLHHHPHFLKEAQVHEYATHSPPASARPLTILYCSFRI